MTAPPRPPKFSVVIPAFNCSKQLQECLDHLQQSTVTDFEVIVVDDSSTDDTVAIAAAIGTRIVRSELRRGPASARNLGAKAARGTWLIFIDADVCIHPDTLERFSAQLDRPDAPDAIFGAYDLDPRSPSLISQYRNLVHHFVHRENAGGASTFWAGCGAIRAEMFHEVGGFSPEFNRPCIEDIELGGRLFRSGRRLVLDPSIQATHLKRWTLTGMVRTDFWDRGVPWTELILRDGCMPNALNLKLSQRLSTVVAWLFGLTIVVGTWFFPWLLLAVLAGIGGLAVVDSWTNRTRHPAMVWNAAGVVFLASAAIGAAAIGWWSAVPLGLLGALVALNLRLFGFFVRIRGPLFASLVVPPHVLYYWCCGLALGVGIIRHLARKQTRERKTLIQAGTPCPDYGPGQPSKAGL